jgi:glucosamine-6-phosphate deaminase
MSDLLHARRILLLVTGKAKRDALRRLLQGPITTRFPASFLHLHPEVTLLVDAAAAGRNH